MNGSRGHITRRIVAMAAMLATTTLSAAESSELSRDVIPVNPEADSQLTLAEIPDVVGLVRLLRTAPTNGPAARLYSFFTPSLKAELTRWEFEDEIPEDLRVRVVKALNRILRRRDLYRPEIWPGDLLATTLRERYLNEFPELGPVDQARMNRLLLHQTFPDLVGAPRVPSFPERPARLHLLGDEFLGSGDLKKGVQLPGGAVWQPSLFAFGQMRVAAQAFDPGEGEDLEELVARWDITFNMALTPTERVVLSLRPLDEAPDFTGYDSREETWDLDLDPEPESLFFEGDLGEIVPNLDLGDSRGLDIGFAVGRQPLTFQRGFLIDDSIDSVGLVRNNLLFPGASNLRLTALYGWGEIDRNGGDEDGGAHLVGALSAFDFPATTLELDAVGVLSDVRRGEDATEGGDSLHLGAGAIQRLGLHSTSFRVNASLAEEGTDSVSDGVLLFADVSTTPAHSRDLVYANAFWAIDNYSAAARRPTAQGPLAPAGILFEGPGLGASGSALSNLADDVAGGAVGYQMVWNDTRSQLIAEIGGRLATSDQGEHAMALGFRTQHAVGQHWIVRADLAGAVLEDSDPRYLSGLSLIYQY